MTHPLNQTSHRPYPLPDKPWALHMRWLNLLFMHWAVPAETLRPLIPPRLELDTFDAHAWLGVVPFEMRDVYPRWTFSVPGLSHFPELNLRTYVRAGGKPGVWFFSLDASNRIAVRLARASFNLPYFAAAMGCAEIDGTVYYQSKRTHRGAAPTDFVAHYQPTGEPTAPDDLTTFLTERYCLYSADANQNVYRGEIHHLPWSLQPARAEVQVNRMTEQIGVTLPDTEPLLHFSKDLTVLAWLPEKV